MNKALSYIMNPEKTEEDLLVSSYGCSAKTAAQEFEWTRKTAEAEGFPPVKIIARHVIQSFDVGEITPELAHEIGKQFADEILKGRYEYVLTTHIDKNHVHNHLIFNAVNFVDHHAYKSYKKIYYEMRDVSDRLCKENGLSVIPPSMGKGMDYKEYTEAKQGTSWKQKLKQTIDRNVIMAQDYDEFLKLMQEAGYEIKIGKYIAFRAEGQERFTRSKTIGMNYTEENIKERIHGRNPRKRRSMEGNKNISLISDIQDRIAAINSKGYEHTAKLIILKEAAKTLNYLTENNLLEYGQLEKRAEDIHGSVKRTAEQLKKVETRLREIQPLIKNMGNFQRLKPVYEEYLNTKDKEGYRQTHEAELIIFEAARTALLAEKGEGKLPSLRTLSAEQKRLQEEQKKLYNERTRLKKEEKEIDTIKKNVDQYLSPSVSQAQERDKTAQRE